MSLATYILRMSLSELELPTGYDLINDIESLQESFLLNFHEALCHAIEADEDVVCFISSIKNIPDIDFDKFEKTVIDLVHEKVYSFYLGAEFLDRIPFEDYYSVISRIEDISCFILTRPIFEYALSLVRGEWKSEDASNWVGIVRFLIPHAFLVDFKLNYQVSKNLNFHIIASFYNASQYLNECWDSVERQIYQNYHIYFTDDCSNDNGYSCIPDEVKLTKIKNNKRLYALQNTINVLLNHEFSDNDVVCILDADDKFSHKYVLSILCEIYKSKKTHLTYGSMLYLNQYRKMGIEYTKDEFVNVRNSTWKFAHLRTFRFHLFKEFLKIDPLLNCLKDEDGSILTMPADMALFFPLVELTDFNNAKFINSPLYEYRLHDNNDQYINRSEQYKGELIVRAKIPLNKKDFF